MKRWPADTRAPEAKTLWRWLGQAVEQGRLGRSGTGRKNDSYEYWLPGQEAKFREDPFYQLHEMARESNRQWPGIRGEGPAPGPDSAGRPLP